MGPDGTILMRMLDSFRNCRVKLYRLQDGQEFYGWIEELSHGKVRIDITNGACSLRDKFTVSAFGHRKKISFVGACIRVDTSQHQDAQEPAEEKRECARSTVELVWVGNGDFEDGKQDTRRKIRLYTFTLELCGGEIQATATDVSLLGIGFHVAQELSIGTEVGLLLPHEKGAIRAKAIVRHCRPSGDGFQAGAQITEIYRVDHMLWRVFVESFS